MVRENADAFLNLLFFGFIKYFPAFVVSINLRQYALSANSRSLSEHYRITEL